MPTPTDRAPITLNLDAGERADETPELWRVPHALSIACGGHAGDEALAARVVAAALDAGAAIAAHPSYPDRAGFGRTSLEVAPEALEAEIHAQCMFLRRLAEAAGARIAAVKPHGALYHDASARDAVAGAVLAAARRALGDDVVLVGRAGGALARLAGPRFLREGFADRGTLPSGELVPRGQPGALLLDPDEVAARARALCASGEVDTICVHGDSPGSLALARAARAEIDRWNGSAA